jgi:hypothetical protein
MTHREKWRRRGEREERKRAFFFFTRGKLLYFLITSK